MPEKIDITSVRTPRLDEYFGLWAIEPQRGLAMFERAAAMDLTSHVQETPRPRPSITARDKMQRKAAGLLPDEPGDDTDSTDTIDEQSAADICVLNVVGTLMKQESSMDESTSTVMLRKMIRDAANNPGVKAIVFCIDSPGGSVAGTADTAAEIKAASALKPCIAFVEDLCASAAYWLASQCDEIHANHGTALIGSIGTFIGTYDYSKAAAQKGIQAKVYATGPLKGTGFPGAEITPEQDAYLQGIVNQTQVFFAAAVAEGRDMSPAKVAKLATGGVFLATDALETGLIDSICTFDQCIARCRELVAAGDMSSTSRGTAAGATLEVPMGAEKTPSAEGTTGAAAPASAAQTTSPPNSAATDTRAELKRYVDTFGASGAQWYLDGKAFDECVKLHSEAQTAQINTLKEQHAAKVKELTDANAKLQAENDQLHARIVELRGAGAPVSADLAADKASERVASKDPGALENRIGPNMAALARHFAIPKDAKKDN